jgi:hypothetical protein
MFIIGLMLSLANGAMLIVNIRRRSGFLVALSAVGLFGALVGTVLNA